MPSFSPIHLDLFNTKNFLAKGKNMLGEKAAEEDKNYFTFPVLSSFDIEGKTGEFQDFKIDTMPESFIKDFARRPSYLVGIFDQNENPESNTKKFCSFLEEEFITNEVDDKLGKEINIRKEINEINIRKEKEPFPFHYSVSLTNEQEPTPYQRALYFYIFYASHKMCTEESFQFNKEEFKDYLSENKNKNVNEIFEEKYEDIKKNHQEHIDSWKLFFGTQSQTLNTGTFSINLHPLTNSPDSTTTFDFKKKSIISKSTNRPSIGQNLPDSFYQDLKADMPEGIIEWSESLKVHPNTEKNKSYDNTADNTADNTVNVLVQSQCSIDLKTLSQKCTFRDQESFQFPSVSFVNLVLHANDPMHKKKLWEQRGSVVDGIKATIDDCINSNQQYWKPITSVQWQDLFEINQQTFPSNNTYTMFSKISPQAQSVCLSTFDESMQTTLFLSLPPKQQKTLFLSLPQEQQKTLFESLPQEQQKTLLRSFTWTKQRELATQEGCEAMLPHLNPFNLLFILPKLNKNQLSEALKNRGPITRFFLSVIAGIPGLLKPTPKPLEAATPATANLSSLPSSSADAVTSGPPFTPRAEEAAAAKATSTPDFVIDADSGRSLPKRGYKSDTV